MLVFFPSRRAYPSQFYAGGTPICDQYNNCEIYLAADLRVAQSDPDYWYFATAAAGFLGGYVFGIPAFVSTN